MPSTVDTPWHNFPAQEVVVRLETDAEKGLDVAEIAKRQARFGLNVLTQRREHGPLIRFLLQFHQPLVYILLAATVITALLQEWVDAAVIFGVVLVNAIVGFLQESKAVTAIAALARSLSSEATVVRSGQRARVDATTLVPGDLVLVQSGDKVPADLRLLRTRDLQIDESALTGESVPVEKRPEVFEPDTPLADRKNLAYASTLVTYGTGRGVVVGIGDSTEIGRISELIATTDLLETPLTRQIKHFSHVLLFVILALAALAFAIGTAHGQPWLDTFMAAVALAVGAIPEGLPAAVTIILAIGVSRMAARRAIIRRLPAVETLGSTTVICSDKTGTLTQNQMTVQRVMAAGTRYEVSGVGYAPEGAITPQDAPNAPATPPALLECLTAGALCNDTILAQDDGQWRVQGDPTEGALLVAAAKAGMQAADLQERFPRLDAIPFESQHQYMATLHDAGPARPRLAYLKGAPESLLPRCTTELDPSGYDRDFDLRQVQTHLDDMTAQGLRVLALARQSYAAEQVTLDHADVTQGLTFLGFQGMLDPPRPEVARAVATCQRAGIRVKMITGDHAVTAAAIARQLGLTGGGGNDGQPGVLTSREIQALSDSELIAAAQHTAVFARVSPEHKLRLVEALQARGEVVAMTGDGVNDAPALRRADIGVAMGRGGTEVAREAADMVLTDDNFASIEAAVEEGRGVYDNLLKFLVWTLPTNGGEAMVIMLAIVLGVSLPILPVQLLWINMTTAVCLGMMLAFEPKDRGIMDRPPRDPHVPILTGALVERIVLVSMLLCAGGFATFEWELASGASEARARTVAVTVFVIGELFYLLNCRSLTQSMFRIGVLTNPWIWVGVTAMLLLQLLFIYLPGLQHLFHSAPVGVASWLRILAVGCLIYGVVELEKGIRRAIARRAA
jgi:Ca2+-transporting ATPase